MPSDEVPAPGDPQPVVRAGSNLGYVAYGAPQAPPGLERASVVRSAPRRLPAADEHVDGVLVPGARATWLTVLASLAVPGAGHWLMGRRVTAACLVVLAVTYWLTVVALRLTGPGPVVVWGVLVLCVALSAGLTAHRTHATARALDRKG